MKGSVASGPVSREADPMGAAASAATFRVDLESKNKQATALPFSGGPLMQFR